MLFILKELCHLRRRFQKLCFDSCRFVSFSKMQFLCSLLIEFTLLKTVNAVVIGVDQARAGECRPHGSATGGSEICLAPSVFHQALCGVEVC